jgi:hypothetical protein
MRSRRCNLDFSKNLLLAAMVAILYFSGLLPMMTNEVLAASGSSAMLHFSWLLPMMTNEVLAASDKFGIDEL